MRNLKLNESKVQCKMDKATTVVKINYDNYGIIRKAITVLAIFPSTLLPNYILTLILRVGILNPFY